MFLLSDSAPARVETMRQVLDGLGSSLLVVGGPDLWNVHVHVDDVGAALEAGVEAGRPHRIRVTHLAEQRGRRGSDPVTPVAVVACAPGEGLADIFRAAGAGVVRSAPGRRASAGQILDEIRAVHALSVIVLPDDSDTQLAAEAAARAAADEGIEVHVVRARAVVQGVAALAVFDPSAGPAGNLLAMSSAAAATRHGAVTVASRDALTDAGPCHRATSSGWSTARSSSWAATWSGSGRGARPAARQRRRAAHRGDGRGRAARAGWCHRGRGAHPPPRCRGVGHPRRAGHLPAAAGGGVTWPTSHAARPAARRPDGQEARLVAGPAHRRRPARVPAAPLPRPGDHDRPQHVARG